MKKLILFALLLVAVPAFAASWTVNTKSNQDARFDRDRLERNAVTCASFGLATNCTQSQARNAFCSLPGSSSPTPPCTLPDGRSSGDVYVFSDIGVYLDKFVIDTFYRDLKYAQNQKDKALWDSWLATASQAQKDAVCAAAGFAAGCLP